MKEEEVTDLNPDGPGDYFDITIQVAKVSSERELKEEKLKSSQVKNFLKYHDKVAALNRTKMESCMFF